jgi:hypothetical protein
VGFSAKASAVLIAVLGIAAMSAQAAVVKPDFHTSAPAQVLPHDGDFDGDGRRDDLYLVNEADSNRIAVHIRLNTAAGAQDIRVTSFDMDSGKDSGLHVVAAGAYRPDCGNFASECGEAIHTRAASLMVTLSSGGTVLVHWRDGRFEQDFVRSDEAAMARVAAALYAENR